MMTPTIHLNGTPKERLLEQIENAYGKLGEAIKALANAAPNGRDYYPQGSDAIYRAQDEHSARMKKLLEVRKELEDLANALPV